MSTDRIRTPIGRENDASVEIRLLGRPRASPLGEPLPLAFPADSFSVVAYVAVMGETERDLLARELWPALSRSEGLARLRRQLALLDDLRPVERAIIERRANRLTLNAAVVVRNDVREFLAHCAAERHSAAIAMYAPLLQGREAAWIARERAALERRYEAAIRAALDACEAAGDAAGAAEHAARLQRLHPLSDDLVQTAMTAYARAGNRSAALETFAKFAERLERDRSAVPLPETRRLRDELAGTPRARRRLGFLPGETSSFIGRESDVAALAGLLREERLVTVAGTAGVGKTRTALRVADHVRDAFEAGAWFVDLTAITDPDLVEPAIAAALAADGERYDGRPLPEALRDKRALLVLDNCERLTATCAALVERLLRATSDLRIIATSREPLLLSGEAVYRLAPLNEADAIALFVRRTRNIAPSSAASDSDARIARICRQLDRLPLAIELAAARLAQLSLDDLEERLSDRLQALELGFRDTAAQHRNLRVAFDWSYDLLSAPARTLFARLSVFEGGWTEAAAAAVCGTSDGVAVTVSLDELRAKSLVTLVERDGQRRFGFLESIREYALQRFASNTTAEERAHLRRSHAHDMLDRARDAARQWGIVASAAWYAAVEVELENVRAVLRWAFEPGASLEIGGEVLALLANFFQMGPHRAEGRSFIERFLAHEERLPAQTAAALWLAHAGFFAAAEQRRTSAQRAYDLYAHAGDETGVALALHRLAIHYTFAGEFDAAADALDRALTVFEHRGDAYRVARCQKTKADLLRLRGDTSGARALYETLLAAKREAGDAVQTESLLMGLAEAHYRLGATDAAIAVTQEALASARARHDVVNVAANELNLAAYLIGAERFDAAVGVSRRALETALEAGVSRLHIGIAIQHIAALAAQAGRSTLAAMLVGFSDRAYRDSATIREFTEARERERIATSVGAAFSREVESAILAEGETLTQAAAVALAQTVESS